MIPRLTVPKVTKPLKLASCREHARSFMVLEDSLGLQRCVNASGAVTSVLVLSLVSLYIVPEVELPRDDS